MPILSYSNAAGQRIMLLQRKTLDFIYFLLNQRAVRLACPLENIGLSSHKIKI